MLKKINEHWVGIVYFVLAVILSVLGIVAFSRNGKATSDAISWTIVLSLIIAVVLIVLFEYLWPSKICGKQEIVLKILTTIFILAFGITSLILPHFFVTSTENQIDVPYEVPETYCYITDTGECYHESSCGYLYNSSIRIPLSTAIARGYRPCSRCWYGYDIAYRSEIRTQINHNYWLPYGIAFIFWGGLSAITMLLFKRSCKN